MCGRYSLAKPPQKILIGDAYFALPTIPPRYNISPLQTAPVIRNREGNLEVGALRWGLVPHWAKDPKIASSLINARSETVATQPAFRSAFKRRRCLVLADGFYEWQTVSKQKLPWRFVQHDGGPLLFAGIWESWHSENPPLQLATYCLLTTTPNAVAVDIHDRMPVALNAAGAALWLNDQATPEQLTALCIPFPDDSLRTYRVDQIVNSSRNEVPKCVEPLDGQEFSLQA